MVALGAGAWFWQSGHIPPVETESTVPAERSFVVKPQAVSQQLDITGTIAAGKSVAIIAPLDGVIREKRVELGEHLAVGDVLVCPGHK